MGLVTKIVDKKLVAGGTRAGAFEFYRARAGNDRIACGANDGFNFAGSKVWGADGMDAGQKKAEDESCF